MQIINTEKHFGLVAIFFHWVMAMIIIGLVALGLYMTSIPVSPQKFKYYGWHKEFGILILMLVSMRIIWRYGNKVPALTELPWWERLAARATHWLFYGFMFALPITGWLMSSASGRTVSFFGLFLLPHLIPANHGQSLLFAEIHTWIAYGLIATFCLHVAAALKHQFIDKDDIMQRIT